MARRRRWARMGGAMLGREEKRQKGRAVARHRCWARMGEATLGREEKRQWGWAAAAPTLGTNRMKMPKPRGGDGPDEQITLGFGRYQIFSLYRFTA